MLCYKAEFCKKKLHRAQRQGQRKRRRLSFGCTSQGSSFADTNQIGWRTRKLQCWRGRARWRFPRADSFQNTPHLLQSASTSSTSLCTLTSSVKMNQHHLCGRSSVCGVQLHCVECPALWIDGFCKFWIYFSFSYTSAAYCRCKASTIHEICPVWILLIPKIISKAGLM